jgi:aerobic carbon-monoxide dehydrogenase large subunit
MTGSATGGRFVGQRVLRREDARFVTGTGKYVDDIVLPGTLHVAFARSHVARGRLTGVETAAAEEMPGVVAVLTAADLNHLVREWWTDLEGPDGQSRQFRLFADGDATPACPWRHGGSSPAGIRWAGS